MLLFELFPAFMAIVCIVAGVALVKMNREASEEARNAGTEVQPVRKNTDL